MFAEPHGTKLCALVVDDDTIISLDASDILAKAGYRVFEAESAEAAISLLERHGAEITLLITDLEMPGRSGVDLAQEVDRRWPHIRIVIASGHAG